MPKPIIGITANVITLDNGADRSAVGTDYITAVELAGGVPIVLPVVNGRTAIECQAELIDGLLLSGGFDVNPLLFGEEPAEKLGYVYTDRDIHEIELVKAANLKNIAVLGICRGIQLINVAFGGTIYQDLSAVSGAIKHMQNAKSFMPTHTVEIAARSLLYSIFGNSIVTNSFHHQALNIVAQELIVTARAQDGIIEGVEKPGDQFFVGVQWHPEMMTSRYSCMVELFRRFIWAAAQ